MRHVLHTLLALLVALAFALPAQAFETRAKAAFVVDVTTGTVLLSKNADVPLPPASMSKLMTLYVTFEAIRDGRLSLDETLPVSQHAMSYGGSTMFLDTTDRVSVIDLLRGVIVLSGNDACAVLAEALSPTGTERGFAEFMTRRGQQMGLTHSTFTNASGWPAPGHRMSMRDLGARGAAHDRGFSRVLRDVRRDRVRLRRPRAAECAQPQSGADHGIGADGLKTGHTQESGYGLVGSAVQDGRRIIWVISGLDTVRQRARGVGGDRELGLSPVHAADGDRGRQRAGRADVWMGAAPSVGLTIAEDLDTLIPALGGDR